MDQKTRKVKYKKPSLQDLLYVGVIIIVFAMGILIAFKISTEINTQLQANDFITTEGKTAFAEVTNMYPGTLDNTFLVLIVGLSIVALILAFMVRVHPVFFVFFLMVLVIVIFLAGIFSNIYLEMANNPEFSALAEQLTFTTTLIGILPFIIGIMGFVLSIVMFKTWQNLQ